MKSTNQKIQSLTALGLNKYESEVYLSLISEGVSTAKNISDITSIPYGKVYEIINALSTKGFIITLPSKPMKCKAVPPNKVVSSIKENELARFEQLEKKVKKELEPLFEKSKKFEESKSVFWVINGRKNINSKIEEIISSAKKKIKILTTENGLKRLVLHKSELKDASKRNVDVSVVSHLTNSNKEDLESLSFLPIKGTTGIPVQLFVIDGKESLLVEASPDDDNIVYGRDLGVWITSPAFTQLLEHAFQNKRSKSK